MVEQAEGFEAELELHALLEREILEQREIDGFRAGAVEQVAAGVAVGVVGGRNRIQIVDREGGGADTADQVSAAAAVGGGPDQIRTVGAAGGGVGGIGSGGDVE